jgi:hypothetical protein
VISRNALLETVIQIFGLYLFAVLIRHLSEGASTLWFFMAQEVETRNWLWASLGQWVLYSTIDISIGLFCLLRPGWIIAKLKLNPAGQFEIHATKKDLIELTIIAIAVIEAFSSLTQLIAKGVEYTYFNENERYDRALFWTERNKADIFFWAFRFCLSALLLVNARYIARRLTGMSVKEDSRPD